MVFTSSVASFSGDQNSMLPDDTRQIPGNSYGAQKAAAELILADASRRGFLDAVSLRLPTVIVRPGRPNKAASSFFSGIVREPLLGLDTELPVADAFRRLGLQPAARGGLAAACRGDGHQQDGAGPQHRPARHQHDRRPSAAGAGAGRARRLIAREACRGRNHRRDRIGTWPPAFEALHARTLGFSAHEPVVEVVRAFIEDDLAATKADRGMAH